MISQYRRGLSGPRRGERRASKMTALPRRQPVRVIDRTDATRGGRRRRGHIVGLLSLSFSLPLSLSLSARLRPSVLSSPLLQHRIIGPFARRRSPALNNSRYLCYMLLFKSASRRRASPTRPSTGPSMPPPPLPLLGWIISGGGRAGQAPLG